MDAATAVRQGRVTVRGVSVRIWEGGTGTPLLFLHGAGGIRSLLPALPLLAQHHRVVAPEHPGFGQSDFPEWLDTVEDLVFHYRDLVDHLGLPPFHLAGLSLGGWIAAEFAVHYSHRLRSLILVDAAGLQVEGAPMADIFALSPQEMARRAWYDPGRVPAPPQDPEEARIQVRNQVATARVAWRGFANPKLPLRLHHVAVPTLVVWGQQDGIIPVAHAHAWAGAIAGSRLAILDRCGHIPPAEQTGAFVDQVVRFLREVEG